MTKQQAKKLKVGDVCVCLDNRYKFSYFTVGRIYKVTDKRGDGHVSSEGDYIDFIDNYGKVTGLFCNQVEMIDTELGKILYG